MEMPIIEVGEGTSHTSDREEGRGKGWIDPNTRNKEPSFLDTSLPYPKRHTRLNEASWSSF